MRSVLVAIAVIGCSGSPARGPAGAGSGSAPVDAIDSTGAPIPRVPLGAVHVAITGKLIKINGIVISGTPMVADFVAVLGKQDRTWDSRGPNRIHTWDRLGVIVYEPRDGRATAASFPYKAVASTFSPKTLFSGAIMLDGKAFGPKLALSTVRSWRGATQPYTSKSIVFDRGEFHVFTIEEKPGTSIDLVELSLWQRNRSRPVRKPLPRVVIDDAEEDCRAGDATRCTSLALAYQTGSKGYKNADRAHEFAKLGCDGRDPFACLMLGNMLAAGRGVAKSPAGAKGAWRRACELGYKAACELAK